MPKWWNGRHAGLKTQCLVRAGSTPAFGTEDCRVPQVTCKTLSEAYLKLYTAPIAQRSERLSSKQKVVGSNPTGGIT